MIKRRRFPKIFFGWWTVLASGFLILWGHGFQYTGFSALFKPLASELGFSRAVTSVASSITRLEGGLEAPVTGWLTDRFGPRWLMLAGVSVIGLSLILMNFVNSLWAYYVVWGVVLGTAGNMALGIPLDKAITNWFVKKRGTAMSIKWVCSALSGVLVLPLMAWLISTQGWRMTCVVGGLVMLLVGLPLVWFFVKRQRPEYYGLLPDGATAEEEAADTNQMIERGVEYAAEVEEVEFTLRQAMRTPAYWLLMVANATFSLVAPALVIHSIPFLTDIGLDPVKAAVMMGILYAVRIPSALVGGFLADRVKKGHLRFLLGGVFLLQAAGFAVFLLNQTIAMAYVFFIVYGIGMAIYLPVNNVLRARYFGRKGFGSIGGTSALFMTPVGIIAPIYAGWIYDTTGSYITAFTVFAGLLAFGGVVMSLIRPPKPPAEVTDIDKFV